MSQTPQDAGVIPDVVKTTPSPDLGLEISWENVKLEVGAKVPRQETTTKVPDVSVRNPPQSQGEGKAPTYTIIMADPDLFMKNDPTGQVRHWLQTNLTISSSGKLVSDTAPVTPYLHCAPGPGPAHRYVFILAEEPKDSEAYTTAARNAFPTPSGVHDLKERMGFYAQEFIDKHQLKIVGLNFMYVAPNAAALVENMKLGAESVAHKVMGK